MKMLSWILGLTKKKRIKHEKIRARSEMEAMSSEILTSKSRWLVHVKRKHVEFALCLMVELELRE